MSYLQPPSLMTSIDHPRPSSQPQSAPSLSDRQSKTSLTITLGGYSYGSLIVKHLPPVPSIIHPFVSPLEGSAAGEILLRARKLADQRNLEVMKSYVDLKRGRETVQKGHKPNLSVSMGGEATSPDKRRSSREIRRSVERSQIRHAQRRSGSLNHETPENDALKTVPGAEGASSITMPKVQYLLVSPLTPPVSMLAAPALVPKFWSRSKEESQEIIGRYPSLAIYGDQDVFVSAKKVRNWTEQIKAVPGSQLTSVEVEGAGHFWVEQGVEEKLRLALRSWEVGIQSETRTGSILQSA